MSEFTRAEACAVAIAETFRGDGEILVSPIGTLPSIGARLAKLTFEPDILLTDGVAAIVANVQPVGGAEGPEPVVESWMPYRSVFDTLWSGRRHVMMGATQIDRFGNQNIACIGAYEKPKAQLLGMRGAPGNTLNHPTSYWVPNHSTEGLRREGRRGVGRRLRPGRRAGRAGRALPRNPAGRDESGGLRLRHPRSLDAPGLGPRRRQRRRGGIEYGVRAGAPGRVPETRPPTDAELKIIREVLDPGGIANREVGK